MKMYSLYHSLCILTLIMNVDVFVVYVGRDVVLLLLDLFLLLVAFVGFCKNLCYYYIGDKCICYSVF